MEGDQKKFWSQLDSGVMYAPPRSLFDPLVAQYDIILSFAAFFSHVPWLGFYAMLIPLVAGPLQAFLGRCREFAIKRMLQGSEKRDLFYYLVRGFRPLYSTILTPG